MGRASEAASQLRQELDTQGPSVESLLDSAQSEQAGSIRTRHHPAHSTTRSPTTPPRGCRGRRRFVPARRAILSACRLLRQQATARNAPCNAGLRGRGSALEAAGVGWTSLTPFPSVRSADRAPIASSPRRRTAAASARALLLTVPSRRSHVSRSTPPRTRVAWKPGVRGLGGGYVASRARGRATQGAAKLLACARSPPSALHIALCVRTPADELGHQRARFLTACAPLWPRARGGERQPCTRSYKPPHGKGTRARALPSAFDFDNPVARDDVLAARKTENGSGPLARDPGLSRGQ